MGYTPHILVVGGGATGTGLARDLAMRGLEVTLVERDQLTSGATGRMHGLLHSGARYAVSDADSARDCLAESRKLKEIAHHCIEETGGLFVSLEGDDDEYFERKRAACEEIGISTDELDETELRRAEPSLGAAAERGFSVPDATVDPFRLTVANARAAQNHGATIRTHSPVTDLLVEDGAISGVEVAGDEQNGTVDIEADYVVNATGAWADEIAGMAGLDVPVRLSKGAMVVMNDRPTERVLNRCRPRDEGDILVPYDDRCILGTTDSEVEDPDYFEESGAEVEDVIDELAALVPDLSETRSIRSYWGVRPLFQPQGATTSETGDVSRDFYLLDHEQRDDTWGMTTVVGGKLTTYRLMAERIADHVCDKFGIRADCRTAAEPLPGSEDVEALKSAMANFGLKSPVADSAVDRLGSRAADVLDTNEPNPVVCECESVTRAEIRAAIDDETGERTDLNEVRIRTRAGMGECQGGRCCHNIAAQLYPLNDVDTIEHALDDLFAERWKGQRHALWGEQLAQAMETYALHATTMNRDAEPADVDLSAFDSGPEWDEDDVNPRGGFPPC